MISTDTIGTAGTVGVLGAGRVGRVLAQGLAKAGHDVVVGVRDGTRPPDWPDGPVRFADHASTCRQADTVLHATPGDTAVARLGALREELAGTVLVDVANATRPGPDGLPGDLCYPGSSLGEHLQQALPGTRVVKTLNTMLFPVMADPGRLSVPPTAFLSGDDPAAKATVRALLADLGWRDGWIEDLGGISTARGPEAMMLLVPILLRSRGFAPFALAIAS